MRCTLPGPGFSDATILQHWLNNATSANYSPSSTPKSHLYPVATGERRTVQIFGGEPGDDTGLCGKMQEMFDSMDWVDTI